MQKNTLVLVPARGGSVGIKDKNIKPFNGRPLISYTINLAKNLSGVNKVVVSTDSEIIKSISVKNGAEVPFLRPSEISGPEVSIEQVLVHAYETLRDQGYTADAIVLLFPTNPLRNEKQINECLDLFYDSKVDCVFTANETPAHYTPYWTIIENENGGLTYFDGSELSDGYARRQDFPIRCFAKNDLVFVISPLSLMKTGSIFGKSSKMIITDPIYDGDINEAGDWRVSEERYISLYKLP